MMITSRLMRIAFLLMLISAIAVGTKQSAHASIELIENGTFDTNLSGWTEVSGDTTQVGGRANVGQFGANMTTVFQQMFDIPADASSLLVSFDYLWQQLRPAVPDLFDVQLSYLSTSGTGTPAMNTVSLLSETSADGSFSSRTFFNDTVSLVDLVAGPNNGTISFRLEETDNLVSNVGTRIELDNVSVQSVPEATSLLIWSTVTGLGLLGFRRR